MFQCGISPLCMCQCHLVTFPTTCSYFHRSSNRSIFSLSLRDVKSPSFSTQTDPLSFLGPMTSFFIRISLGVIPHNAQFCSGVVNRNGLNVIVLNYVLLKTPLALLPFTCSRTLSQLDGRVSNITPNLIVHVIEIIYF